MKDWTTGSVTKHLLHMSMFLAASMLVRKRLRFDEPEDFIPASATAS